MKSLTAASPASHDNYLDKMHQYASYVRIFHSLCKTTSDSSNVLRHTVDLMLNHTAQVQILLLEAGLSTENFACMGNDMLQCRMHNILSLSSLLRYFV